MQRIHTVSLLLLLALGASGCEEGIKRPPPVRVNVVNAAAGFAELAFLRGGRDEAALRYNDTADFTFDSDTYTFRITRPSPNQSEQVVVDSFTSTLSPESRYFIVLMQDGVDVNSIIYARPKFDTQSPDFQFSVVHAAPMGPTADVYMESAGTDLLNATPIGTLSFQQDLPVRTLPAGNYEVTLTEPGNPANVLFKSNDVTYPSGASFAMVLTDGANAELSALNLVVTSSTPLVLNDTEALTAVRVINGAADGLARDVYINDDLTAPLVSAIGVGAASAFIPFTPGATKITITPAGNPSVIELEQTVSLGPGAVYNAAIGGDSAELGAFVVADDRRRILDRARVQIFNTINYYETALIFIKPVGTDTSSAFPEEFLNSPSGGTRTPYAPGDYELTIREPIANNVIFGPQPYTLAAGGVYTMVALDSGDGTNASVLFVDDIP